MRDNSKRLAANADPAPAVAEPTLTLDFSAPTEIVDLPSKGRFYSEAHPLHNAETVEIKFMTAKDEDILTSPTLLKKGLAIDRFIQNILVNKGINPTSLLTGDKNAILIASRINGFGSDYSTKMTCPNCAAIAEHTFDLSEVKEYFGDDLENYNVTSTSNGTFIVTLPKSGFQVEVKPLTGREENELTQQMEANRKKKIDKNLTDQLKKIVVSINGVEDKSLTGRAIDALPAFDSRYLRAAYSRVIPGIDMTQYFECEGCGYEKEVEIPMTVDFFWPKQ